MRGLDSTTRTTGTDRLRSIANLMRLWCSLALALTVLISALGWQASPAAASMLQESTPEAGEEVDGEEVEVEVTEEPDQEGSAGPSQDLSLSPGYPAVLAQGLTYIPGGTMVWTVREFEVPALDAASAEAGVSAFYLQRQGTTIIRNDVTGKRAKLEPGESFFRAADDSYTSSADGASSLMWSFELVDQDAVQADAFYEGPLVEDLQEGIYDFEMIRFTLGPGDSVNLPAFTDTALTMVLGGELEVTDVEMPASLLEGDGKSLQSEDNGAVASNSGSSDAMFVFIALGDEVSDETAGAAAATEATAEPTVEPESETETESEPEPEPVETEESSESPDPPTDGTVNSISVTAIEQIYVTIVVDGTTAYDGTLEAGQSTGALSGSSFEVYTTSGANTHFTNGCGDTFWMGYEEGEANYVLTAEPC